MGLRFVQLPPYRHRKRSRESFLSRLCCSLRSSVYMKHRIPPMLGASGFPFLFTRIHCFTANEKDFSLALEMTVRESGILAALPSPAGRLWCGDTALPLSYGRRCPEGRSTNRNKKEWGRSIFPYRHPERSRGIFVAILFLTSSAMPLT